MFSENFFWGGGGGSHRKIDLENKPLMNTNHWDGRPTIFALLKSWTNSWLILAFFPIFSSSFFIQPRRVPTGTEQDACRGPVKGQVTEGDGTCPADLVVLGGELVHQYIDGSGGYHGVGDSSPCVGQAGQKTRGQNDDVVFRGVEFLHEECDPASCQHHLVLIHDHTS